jgi:uncharacterized membrane protein YphA (DoxX/SURF4 family)
MGNLIPLGKWLFLLPFALHGFNHLMSFKDFGEMVPGFLPLKTFWIILIGLCQLAFVLSVIIGKYDKLGAVLVAVMCLAFVLMIYVPSMFKGSHEALYGLVKDAGLAGGALMYAGAYAKDKSFVG